MIALGAIAPVAAVVGLRTLSNACSAINPLGLPWETPPLVAVRLLCLAVIAVSTVLIVLGRRRPDLRATAVALTRWSAISVAPVLIVLFMLVFGDPDPANCPIG